MDEGSKDVLFQSPKQPINQSLELPQPSDKKHGFQQHKCSMIDNPNYKPNSSWNYINLEIVIPTYFINAYNQWGYHNQPFLLPVTYKPFYINSIQSQGGYLVHNTTTNLSNQQTNLPPTSLQMSQKKSTSD